MFHKLLSTTILAILVLAQGAVSAPQPGDVASLEARSLLELRSTCCAPDRKRDEILKKACIPVACP
ncbi:hypothetical protein B0H13DRAFT_2318176 [Mycena leptocephala]|nr:hypothetical protein B0H13DRAFT_2318176 [Mycena leptocephala]